MRRLTSPRRGRRLMLLAAATLAEPIALKLGGYPLGGNTVVRCRSGHLFTTIWIPGASLKALRLGWARFQYCPVGRHWTLVTPVKESALSEEERILASGTRDLRIP